MPERAHDGTWTTVTVARAWTRLDSAFDTNSRVNLREAVRPSQETQRFIHMAGSRRPGATGSDSHDSHDLNDGTSARTHSPAPGPLRSATSHHPVRGVSLGHKPRRRRTNGPLLKTLNEGAVGADVWKLHALLNVRIHPSPALVIDSRFGAETSAAVQQYQRGVGLSADGIVGGDTWARLMKGDEVHLMGAPALARKPRRLAAPVATPDSIWEWPLDKKLLAVLEKVPSRLPGRVRAEFLGMLNLQSLALTLAIIAGFCILSGGTALILGAVMLGVDATMSLAAAVQIASLASSRAELDEAADELAHVVIAVGVVAFIHGVGKLAKGPSRGAPPEPRPPAEPKAKPAPRAAEPSVTPSAASTTAARLRALAARPGTSTEQLMARRQVAMEFYRTNCPELSKERLLSHLKGIDYTKPVEVGPPPPAGRLGSWHAPDAGHGQYFGAWSEQPPAPSSFGIGDTTLNSKGEVVRKVFTAKDDGLAPRTYLRSTAQGINDNFSLPTVQKTDGGAQQYFVPRSAWPKR